MATRIRKLARQLGKQPADILGVLHALGFQRYRSPEDMLPGNVEAKLRKGLRAGVTPVAVEMPTPPRPTREPMLEDLARGGGDVMQQLLPDVTPSGKKAAPSRAAPARPPARGGSVPAKRPPAVPAKRPPAVAAKPAPPDARVLDTERQTLESLRRAAASERAVVETEQAALATARQRLEAREANLVSREQSLAELERSVAAEREALAAERKALHAHTAHAEASATVPLQSVLEDRGLRGADEFERALGALATGRHLRDVLWTLRVDAREQLDGVLAKRLVLAERGAPDAAIGTAASVEVAPERAEVPSAAGVAKRLGALGEKLLLQGMRRLLIVGAPPRAQRLFREGLDDRVVVKLLPSATRDRAAALEDVKGADAILLWDVEATDEAREVYEAARPAVAWAKGPALGHAVTALVEAIDG